MEKPAQEQVAKLPQWAQKYIKGIEGERESAIRTLNEAQDKQTKSNIYYEDHICTGEAQGPTEKIFYVQSRSITVVNAGVKLEVRCWEDSPQHEDGIELSWCSADHSNEIIACVPKSFMQMNLCSARNMRVVSDGARLRQFKHRMGLIAKKNKDEWDVWVNCSEKGYHVEVFETAENHIFTEGYGPTLPHAIEEAENDVPEMLVEWGYKPAED